MLNPTDGTKVAPHGMFYMEDAGGCAPELDARRHRPRRISQAVLGRKRKWAQVGRVRAQLDTRPSNSVNRRALELAGARASCTALAREKSEGSSIGQSPTGDQNMSQHRVFDALEHERARRRANRETWRQRRALGRDQNLARRRLRFKPGCQINRATDCSEIAAGGRKFTDFDLAGVDADPNIDRFGRPIEMLDPRDKRGFAALLDIEGCHHRSLGVALDLDRKVEDRHETIAHLFVDDAVVRPDALSALILEDTDDITQLDRVHSFGEAGVTADVGKQDGGGGRDVPVLLDPTKGTFADRANIRVHLALCDAENSERHCQQTTDWDRNPHLIPAATADTSIVANGSRHLTTFSKDH